MADAERAELIEGESAVRTLVDRVFDAGELGVEGRFQGLLPGLRMLEGNPAAAL
ncbi:hypothetical protein [Streptomyces mirabilis]|uniref:hypothetical protein n=1 Tax=Streptomyces mirabilis TaxID=68239 RepID=UPI0036DCF60D